MTGNSTTESDEGKKKKQRHKYVQNRTHRQTSKKNVREAKRRNFETECRKIVSSQVKKNIKKSENNKKN